MRVLKRSPWLNGLGLMLAVSVLMGTGAGADVTTDQPGSIVIFPKVIADGTRDTLIELTNTSNNTRFVHCIYVNGAGTCSFQAEPVLCTVDSDCPDFAIGETCEFQWQEENFGIRLTRQQPTIWRVSTGRLVNPGDAADGSCDDVIVGQTPRQDCPGFDPGNVPPAVGQPFRGELKCIEVEESEMPSSGNSLKGEAVLETLRLGSGPIQISKYNAIAVQAVSSIDGGSVDDNLALELNNSEYNACPESLEVIHHANLASDETALDLGSGCDAAGLCAGGTNPGTACTPTGSECLGGGVCQFCPVRTEFTLIPCTQDFESQVPVSVNAAFRIIDEQEFPTSAGADVTCWLNRDIADIGNGVEFNVGNQTPYLKTRIRSSGRICLRAPADMPQELGTSCTNDADCGGAAAGGLCGPAPGLLGVVEEFYEFDASISGTQLFGTAASTMHMIGTRSGFCRNPTGVSATACDSDADCPSGFCHNDGTACVTDADCDNTGSTAGLNTCDYCLIDRITVPALISFECDDNSDCNLPQVCDLATFTCVNP